MCVGRNKDLVTIPRDQYRRLLGLERSIRGAIDGAGMESAFRVQGDSDYDRGYYKGMLRLATEVYNVLPETAPFD